MITVFTHGWFAALYPGYVDLLERARDFGNRLVVGLHSDRSVRPLKGAGRQLVPQEQRAAMLRSLRCIDEVIIFDEPTPARLIESLKPDVLIKSIDVPDGHIVGADTVWQHGGRVLSLLLQPEYSMPAMMRHFQDDEDSRRRPEAVAPDKHNVETPLMWVLRKHDNAVEAFDYDRLSTGVRAQVEDSLPPGAVPCRDENKRVTHCPTLIGGHVPC
jgi:rfaE bifunctional protein nucleotidyltransferase chain/domain